MCLFINAVSNNNAKEVGSEIDRYYASINSCGEFGSATVLSLIIAVNKILKKTGHQKINITEACSNLTRIDDTKPATLEEFVSYTTEAANLDYTNIIQKFKSIISNNNLNDIAEISRKIDPNELSEIKKFVDNDIEDFINLVICGDILKTSCLGYDLYGLPQKDVNDAMHYAKDAVINVIKDAAKDIWDIITGQNQINLMPKLPNPEAFVIQQLPQPLVAQQSVFTPVPNYTGNKDIMKHFVIGNNVVIYDPNQQQMFEKDLVDLSKALDKVDKELGLKEPSKYGFDTFFDTFNFRATRLNKENKFVQPQDISNYIAVTRDQVNGYFITKPDKKPVQQQGVKDNKK